MLAYILMRRQEGNLEAVDARQRSPVVRRQMVDPPHHQLCTLAIPYHGVVRSVYAIFQRLRGSEHVLCCPQFFFVPDEAACTVVAWVGGSRYA